MSVEINPQLECYADVPVLVNNSSRLKFLRPATNTVTDTSSLIQCSDPSVPYFKVRGSWYFLAPQLSQVPTPSMATSRLDVFDTWEMHVMNGIYPGDIVQTLDDGVWLTTRKREASNILLNLVSNEQGDSWSGDWSKSGLTRIIDQGVRGYVLQGSAWWMAAAAFAMSLVHSILWILWLWCAVINRGPARAALQLGQRAMGGGREDRTHELMAEVVQDRRNLV